jgi:hypothetical protein
MLLLVGCGGGVSGAISVKDLLKEFDANAVVAEEKYKGKDLLIEGKVYEVDYSPAFMGTKGYYYIKLDHYLANVICIVSTKSEVMGISKGDNIAVQGRFSRYEYLDLYFKPCALYSEGSLEATAEAGVAEERAAEVPVGPGRRIPVQGADHTSQSQTHPDYNSVPATSGWHYGGASAPAPWGVHGDALPDEILVHNLEHGGVGIHYNCPEGCDELVSQLKEIADRMGKVILSPYPGMETKIALTAWTFLDTFDEFDKDRVEDFARAHESSPNAPEYLVR